MKIYKYNLEIVVFLSGGVVMIFELLGSRILAPYFGTSIFVWTSLIGVILGSLSLGYYLGGKMADKRPNLKSFSLIIFLAAVFILLTTVFKSLLLVFLQKHFSNIYLSSLIASIFLFLPTSILLGMVSPYAVKLKLHKLSLSGSTVGNLYAISTVGSIVGTFLSGFYLISHFGTNKLLLILSLVLILTALFVSAKNLKLKVFVLVILAVSWNITNYYNIVLAQKGFIDTDTAYSRVWIYDSKNKEGERIRNFVINSDHNSAMFLDKDDLVFEYSKYYNLVRYFNPDFRKALVIGGAGYSYPKELLLHYPQTTVDVVEIDPKVTELAKKYFKLKENNRLKIYHQDARVYLNNTDNKYDVIFGDAFTSHLSIPYQLTSKEAVQETYDHLNDDGIVILNLIASLEGKKSRFLRAEHLTYSSIFPQVYLFSVNNSGDNTKLQNIALIALKSDKQYSFSSPNKELNGYLQHVIKKKLKLDLPILTDDFAPVDYYINEF